MRFDVDLERIRKIAEDYYRNGDNNPLQSWDVPAVL